MTKRKYDALVPPLALDVGSCITFVNARVLDVKRGILGGLARVTIMFPWAAGNYVLGWRSAPGG